MTIQQEILRGSPGTQQRVRLAGVPTAVLAGGEGPPVVLLHGSGEFAAGWLPVLPGLMRTHRVIAPDLPGHGDSELCEAPLDADRVLRWLDELIEQTCAEPPVLMGHGLGGAIAARYAVDRSDRLARLVLVDSFGLGPFEPAPSFGLALNRFLEAPTESTRDDLFGQCFVDLDRVRARIGDRWEEIAEQALRGARSQRQAAALGAMMPSFGVLEIPAEALARITVPTSLIWGRHDLAVDVRVAAAAAARHGWPLHVIDGSGDDPAVEQPEAFLAAAIGEIEVLRAGDDGFDEACVLWNGLEARTPAAVVQPASSHQVVAALRYARDHDLPLGIKGGGHNIAGTAIPPGGLMLDMSRMRDVVVDPVARLAYVGPGCRLQDVDRATQEHGLATVLGFISDVGVAGLTLGGGIGYLTRRFGWAVDNLAEVEVVTADGKVHTANRERNADLFWAIRGAGHNFGVVTRFTYRLHKVGPTVYGGLIAWPFERAEEILPVYRKLTSEAPRELSVWLVLLEAPPAPFVPEAWHGKKLCAMAVCYTGDLADTETALAPIRALGEPAVDLLAEQPYTQVQSYLDGTEPKGNHYYWRTEFVPELSDELLATVRELFATCPMPGGELGFLHLDGALNERAADDGAVGNRDARFVLGVKGMWDPDEPREDEFRQWVRAAGERLRGFSKGATYINFQTADEGNDRVRATYGDNYDRLVEVKRRFDPENLFRSNRNINPADTTWGT